MHDKLYENFRSISQPNMILWAKTLGLDVVRFEADLKSGKYKAAVEKEQAEGEQAGVQGTPTLFVNGKRYNGALEVEAIESVLQAELKSIAAAPARPSRRSQ